MLIELEYQTAKLALHNLTTSTIESILKLQGNVQMDINWGADSSGKD